MRKVPWISVGLLVLAAGLVMVTPPAPAPTITMAKISGGVAQVRGRQAAPEATITWEREAVTQVAWDMGPI